MIPFHQAAIAAGSTKQNPDRGIETCIYLARNYQRWGSTKQNPSASSASGSPMTAKLFIPAEEMDGTSMSRHVVAMKNILIENSSM